MIPSCAPKTKESVWARIETLVDGVPGWTPIDQLYTLFLTVFHAADLPGDIIEVGSWCGRSSVVLGAAAKAIGEAKVYCIDLFPEKNDWKQNADGSYSFDVRIGSKTYGGHKQQTVWKEPFEAQIAPVYERHEVLQEIFNETIRSRLMEDVVHSHKGDSTSFFKTVRPDFKCKVAFLDGEHSYEAVCDDIRNIERFLVPGGWICFDDAFSCYEGVDRAISDLIINNPQYHLCEQMTRKFFVARRKS